MYRVPIGSWSSASAGNINFVSNSMETKIANFSVKTVYKVVLVKQPPFVSWNATTGITLLSLIKMAYTLALYHRRV